MDIKITSRSRSSDDAPHELQFSPRSPLDYSKMLLEQAGIRDLKSLNIVFVNDPGFDVEVRQRAYGFGVQFDTKSIDGKVDGRSSWVLFERLPGQRSDYMRARVFNSFEGAAAEFAVKLRLHDKGDVKVTESQTNKAAWQLSFSSPDRVMLMAPFESAAAAASSTR